MMWEINVQQVIRQICSEDLKSLDIQSTGKNRWHLLHNQKSYSLFLLAHDPDEKKLTIRINDQIVETTYSSETDLLLKKLGFSASAGNKINQLKSPMPGLVVDIRVKAGDVVEAGEPLLILEAMKMENLLKAPATVVIKKVAVEKKQSVEKGQILIEFGE